MSTVNPNPEVRNSARRRKLERVIAFSLLQTGANGLYRLMGGKGKAPSMLGPYSIGAAASKLKAKKKKAAQEKKGG